jgi:UDP-2,3-diacylglucosamine pyrophosphatase LpxH
MRALVVSDTHFGAWTGDDLLRHRFALDALEPALDEVDELIILGDLYDFLFSTVENAFASAEGFFDLVERKMAGKRLVFSAGNHDHHIMVRQLRTVVEYQVATADEAECEAELEGHRGFFKRYLDRRLPDVESEIVYPAYRFGNALCFHGHYLDAHMTGSLPDRLLNRGTWGIAGGRTSRPTISDYEATIVPLTELLFTVAQLPRGTEAQKAAQAELERVAHIAALMRAPVRELRRIARAIARRNRASDADPTRTVDPSAHPSDALCAYGKVVRNLGWDRETKTMVFAHTHQPLDACADDTHDGLRFWNTGSWIYEPPSGDPEAWQRYRERAWPGSVVLLDTNRPEPELVRLLEDYAAKGPGWRPAAESV